MSRKRSKAPSKRPLAEALEPRTFFSAATQYLAAVMDQYAAQTDVYTDAGAAGNHFLERGKIFSDGGEAAVGAMDEAWAESPQSGQTAIACAIESRGSNSGGWIFQNGVFRAGDTAPSPNWGTEANAGLNLTGATELTLWAKGAVGGEKVEFFALGVGYSEAGEPQSLYHDSSGKVGTGTVTLSTSWTRYTIDLTGVDLSYVLDGFGWMATAADNHGNVQFYLDNIQYDRPRLDEPHFLVSYETENTNLDFDKVMKSAAYVYDQDVALLAFLAAGELGRAGQLADAFVYAAQHDPFYTDGRLRNAYLAGDLKLPPGWTPNGHEGAVRTAGWYDTASASFQTDPGQAGTSTGTMAWTMLSLLKYYQAAGGDTYLSTAEALGEWVWKNCRSTRGRRGFTGGFVGSEPAPQKLTYKSTEHNVDLNSAYTLLYQITGAKVWKKRAKPALAFVKGMWDKKEQKFWTGTRPDGKTINYDVVPVEVQALGVLALGNSTKPNYRAALDYADAVLSTEEGYDFNQDRDGVWLEGTAMMAEAHHAFGTPTKAQALLDYLRGSQDPDGSLLAASKDGLTTGFAATADQLWTYFSRKSVTATSWLELAEDGVNPLAV